MPKYAEPGDEILQKQFANRLTEAVVGSGKSRAQICTEMRTERSQLSRWENGHEMPGGHYLSRLGKTLGCDLHWLITGDGMMKRRKTSVERQRLELVRLAMQTEISSPTLSGILRQLQKARAAQQLHESSQTLPAPSEAPPANPGAGTASG